MISRTEASRALAKAIAYKQCGKDREAEEWARRLVEILECATPRAACGMNPRPRQQPARLSVPRR